MTEFNDRRDDGSPGPSGLKAGDRVRHKLTDEVGTVLKNHGYLGVEVRFGDKDRMVKKNRLVRHEEN